MYVIYRRILACFTIYKHKAFFQTKFFTYIANGQNPQKAKFTFYYLITVNKAHSGKTGNYGNLLSLFFGKNFVKTTFVLTKLLNS